MSLKAKIEAVIYASEEPVTLVQLMGLLGEEAQLELEARDAEQPMLEMGPAEPEADDPDALNAETLAVGVVSEDAEVVEPTPGGDETAAEDGTPASVVGEKAVDEKALAKVRERKLRAFFREVLDALIAEYAKGDRGLEVREVAGGFRLATKPEYHDAVRGFVKQLKPPLKLTLQALETLAVVAYKQPVTAPEVSEIRGVDSGGVLGSLLARKLVVTAGRKQVIGRPMLYKTSKEFLVRFGLKDINELPSIEEFEKMAGELNEAGIQEEMEMGEAIAGSHSLDEMNSAPEVERPAHEDADEVVDEKLPSPKDAEPMAEVHEAQADGVPADDFVVDGREVGGERVESGEESDVEDSEELDAEVQSGEKAGE